MPPRTTTKRDSPSKTPSSNRKWTGRFSKHIRRSANREVNGNDGGSDSEQNTTEESSTFESHGPLPLQSQLDANHQVVEAMHASTLESIRNSSSSHAQPPPQLLDTTKRGDSDNQSIDGDIGDCALKPSTSYEKSILATAFSSSTGDSDSNKANYLTSPPSNPHQTPSPTPSASTQFTYHQRTRAGSNALETPKDKIDDDAYAAWWFMASISESFDTFHTNRSGRKTPEQQQLQTNITNENSRESHRPTGNVAQLNDNKVGGKARSVCDNGNKLPKNNNAMYELPSWTHSESSHPRHLPQQSQHVGGEYTWKEQRIRKESLNNDPLGGNLNYDQTPYYYVPPQHASIAPSASSNTAWDTTRVRNKRSEDNIEWTPQDSSYGAAVPACGWVPKRIRKLLEVIVVVLLTALLIFVVVETGIKLKSSGSGGGEDIYFDDDDHYVAFNDDDDGGEDSASNDSNGSNDASDSNHGNR